MQERRHISILVLPTDACNMHCSYCFHAPHHTDEKKMDIRMVRKLYEAAAADYTDVHLIWHGGEPLLMGADFYREAIGMQKEYPATQFKNSMQSNISLITEDIADCIKDCHIKMGSSFDGVRNEILRGNTDLIMRNGEVLKCHGIQCGFIMVLSAKNIDTLIESYELFKRLGTGFSMNPYIGGNGSDSKRFSLDAEHTIGKLIDFFEYWIQDTFCNISVTNFERILLFISKGQKNVCKYSSCMGRWMAVRHDGRLMPCNRYFPLEYSYGNLSDYTHLSEAFLSKGFKKLISQSVIRRNKCKQCEIYDFCEGGCNHVAYHENGISNNGGRSCQILREVFPYIQKRFLQIQHEGNYERYNPVLLKFAR